MRRLGVAQALIGGDLLVGDVSISSGRIADVGLSPPGRGTAAPGFVDLQVNGFAGIDCVTADEDGYLRMGHALAQTGVTAWLPTFISDAPSRLETALEVVAEVRAGDNQVVPRVLGAHLEGPFVSPAHAGAHPLEWLREPDPDLLTRFLATEQVRLVTLAPELPGALDLIGHLVAQGVAVACGHSGADAVQSAAAFDRGARAVTHLFNAMRPLHHRDVGLVGVALTRDDVTVPLIVDGVHLAPEAVLLAWRTAADRVALVTDATAAVGMPDGNFQLGSLSVTKAGAEVRWQDGSLAGSALSMDQAVRNACTLGVPLQGVLRAASRTPAQVLHETVRLAPGAIADVVILDDNLHVSRTIRAGTEIG